MIKKGFSHIGLFFLYLLSLLPLSVLYILASVIYYPLYYIFGYRKKVVRQNLQNSFPEKSDAEITDIEKEYFRYLARLVVEIVKMTTISKKELNKRFKFKNLHLLEQYLTKGESILLSSSHYGNWELGMLAIGLQLSKPSYVIYKPLNNSIFEKWFYNMRSKFGNTMVAMKRTLRVLTATKTSTTVFCFAGDQTPAKEEAHHWIDFLHQHTPVFMGLEKIGMQTNRPVFYCKVYVIKPGYYEVDIILLSANPRATETYEITKKQFSILEESIRDKPAYWLWSHRRWKYTPQDTKYGA